MNKRKDKSSGACKPAADIQELRSLATDLRLRFASLPYDEKSDCFIMSAEALEQLTAESRELLAMSEALLDATPSPWQGFTMKKQLLS